MATASFEELWGHVKGFRAGCSTMATASCEDVDVVMEITLRWGCRANMCLHDVDIPCTRSTGTTRAGGEGVECGVALGQVVDDAR